MPASRTHLVIRPPAPSWGTGLSQATDPIRGARSKASRDFASANGRIQIIEGRNLKHMLKEHLGLDVLIGLDKLPPGWQKADVA
jgi:hypothetical protein